MTEISAQHRRWIWLDDEVAPPSVCPIPWCTELVWCKSVYDFIKEVEDNGLPGFISFDYYMNTRGGDAIEAVLWLSIWIEDDLSRGWDEFEYDVHSRAKDKWPEIIEIMGPLRDSMRNKI